MTSSKTKLDEILMRIESAPETDRHSYYAALSAEIEALTDAGETVPLAVRDLAEELLAEGIEARFDNMPV